MRAIRLVVVGVVLACGLAFPEPARANLWDFIYKLSGPQLSSFFVLHCEYDLQRKKNDDKVKTYVSKDGEDATSTECRFYDQLFKGNLVKRPYRSVWLSLDATEFASTGKDSEGVDYTAFAVSMLALEPMLEIGSRHGTWRGTNWRLHHGLVGLSYDLLWGDDFKGFQKLGYKFRPIGVTYGHVNGSFTVRWFPDGFTPDEFGKAAPPPPNTNRKNEWVLGGSFGYLW